MLPQLVRTVTISRSRHYVNPPPDLSGALCRPRGGIAPLVSRRAGSVAAVKGRAAAWPDPLQLPPIWCSAAAAAQPQPQRRRGAGGLRKRGAAPPKAPRRELRGQAQRSRSPGQRPKPSSPGPARDRQRAARPEPWAQPGRARAKPGAQRGRRCPGRTAAGGGPRRRGAGAGGGGSPQRAQGDRNGARSHARATGATPRATRARAGTGRSTARSEDAGGQEPPEQRARPGPIGGASEPGRRPPRDAPGGAPEGTLAGGSGGAQRSQAPGQQRPRRGPECAAHTDLPRASAAAQGQRPRVAPQQRGPGPGGGRCSLSHNEKLGYCCACLRDLIEHTFRQLLQRVQVLPNLLGGLGLVRHPVPPSPPLSDRLCRHPGFPMLRARLSPGMRVAHTG